MDFRPATIWDAAQIQDVDIRHVHPAVMALYEDWKLYRDAYTSTGGFIDGSYLNAFPGEESTTSKNKYHDRIELAKNDIPADYRKYIDIYVGYLTQEQPVLEILDGETSKLDTTDEYPEVYDNADKDGSTIYDVLRDLILESMMMGTSVALVDIPRADMPAQNAQDRMDRDLLPYICVKGIETVIDYEYAPDGKLEWVKFGEAYDSIRMGWGTFKIWTSEKWIMFDSSGIRIAEGVHPCGQVPIAIYRSNRVHIDTLHVHAPLKSIARLDVTEYNRQSELTEIIRNCAFPRYYGPPIEKSVDKQAVLIGTSNYIEVSPGDQAPGIINADAGSVASLIAVIQEIRQKKMDDSGVPEASGQPVAESGVAKSYRFRQFERRLITLGKLFEKPTRDVLFYIACWIDGYEEAEDYDIKCLFPDSYDVFSANDDLQLLTDLATIPGVSPTLEKEIQKRLALKLLPQDSDQIYTTIEAEIDNDLALSLNGKQPDTDDQKVDAKAQYKAAPVGAAVTRK